MRVHKMLANRGGLDFEFTNSEAHAHCILSTIKEELYWKEKKQRTIKEFLCKRLVVKL